MTAVVAVMLLVAPARADDAKALFERGSELYRTGDFAGAAKVFEQLYDLTPDVQVLFAWAQATRFGGNCPGAIAIYDKLGDLELTPANRAAVEKNRGECVKEIEAAAPPPPPPPPPPPAVTPAPATSVTAAAPADDPSPWYLDPIGGTAVATGAVMAGVGVALYISARSADRAAKSTDSLVEYVRLSDRARTRGRLGVAAGFAGVGLIGAGIAWYVLRPDRAPEQTLAAWIDGGGGGVAVAGSF